MKVAITHDWLVSYGGAEKVLEGLLEIYPNAPVFTSIYDPINLPKSFQNYVIKTSFINNLPFVKEKYRDYLPLMPFAFASFDFSGYDLIISSSHACAKGIRRPAQALHICYCHTPMRYAYDMFDEYMKIENISFLKKYLAPVIMHFIRKWDISSSKRVDYFIANSKFIAERIKKYYGRESEIIYPPVETDYFKPADLHEDYFLVVSRLVPQKRTDIVIAALNELNRPLKIIGAGRDLNRLKKIAKENIEFLGYRPNETVRNVMSKCRALIFPGKEDFGIVPLEAQSCGKPVIVYNGGGAKETLIPGKTGILFDEQTAESLIDAIRKFEKITFGSRFIREFARGFDRRIFKEKIKNFIEGKFRETI